jgi:hypothetical protein
LRGPQRQSPFGQLHGRVRVARVELLFHQPAHTDEPRTVIGDKRLVGLGGQLRIARHLGALSEHQLGQFGALEVFLRPLGLADRKSTLTGSKRHHALGQRLEPFSFGAAVEVAADGRFIPVEEAQRGDQKAHRLEQQPDRQQQDQRQHNRDDWREHELPARNRQESDVIHLGQEADAVGKARHDGNEDQDFQQGPKHVAVPFLVGAGDGSRHGTERRNDGSAGLCIGNPSR